MNPCLQACLPKDMVIFAHKEIRGRDLHPGTTARDDLLIRTSTLKSLLLNSSALNTPNIHLSLISYAH